MIKGMVLYKKSSGTKLLYSDTRDNVIYGVVQEVSGKTYPEKSVQAIISKGYWDAVYLTNDDVEKHQQHDQQSHGSWAQQKPNLDYQISDYIEETLPWVIAEAEKRGYGPAYTMGQIPKDETVPQGLRNLHEEFNQKNSSTESAKALEFYTSDNYKKVNNALRDGTFNPQDSVVTDIDIIVNDLDSLISQSNKTSATVEVFRGIKGTNSLSDLKVGQGFTDKAYTSTTLDPRLALTSFSSPRSGKILRITVPKGTRGIYVPDWFGAKDERAQTKKEQEFILPRGSSFRVTNIDGNVISLEMDSIE
jgi:hypothetical protein